MANYSWRLCLQKCVWLSSVLLLLPYYNFFSISVSSEKCEKDINQNFMSNKLNVWTLFCKKANLWTFGAYLWRHFFWNVKSKKYSLGSNCFLCIVLPVSSKYFLMKPCDTLMINSALQNKSWVTWKNDAPRLLWEGLEKLSQPREQP